MLRINKKEGSVAIVVCYIGKLPWYFIYFIHSCKYNTTVDFIIVTDDEAYTFKVPINVKLVYMSLTQINELATRKLGFKTSIVNGYKLCDFKPTYGILFSELIHGYDFWGHGDIDLIFGDIRAFINQKMLREFELISVRHDFLTGQFLLFKNNDNLNALFTRSKDYKRVLQSEQHFCFDETNFQWNGFTEGRAFDEIPSEIESMTHLAKRLQNEEGLKVHFDFLIVEGVPGKLNWSKGKLFYRNKYEILLYHMVVFKKVCVAPKSVKRIPDTFRVSPTRIYHY
jgi:hypothetical protein